MRFAFALFVFAVAIACSRNEDVVAKTNRGHDASVAQTTETDNAAAVRFDEIATRLDLPRPEDFRVKESDDYTGAPRPVLLDSKRAKEFRSVIRESADRGPNFAGSYTVITWGAGMGNFSFVIANARTGRLLYPPFQSVSRAGYNLQLDESEPAVPAFRKDSTLFAFMGCPGKDYQGCENWDADGFYVYSFENEQLRLVRFIKRDDFNAAAGQKN